MSSRMRPDERLIVALDLPTRAEADALASQLESGGLVV